VNSPRWGLGEHPDNGHDCSKVGARFGLRAAAWEALQLKRLKSPIRLALDEDVPAAADCFADCSLRSAELPGGFFLAVLNHEIC